MVYNVTFSTSCVTPSPSRGHVTKADSVVTSTATAAGLFLQCSLADITTINSDDSNVTVFRINATNSALVTGGGVDAAIANHYETPYQTALNKARIDSGQLPTGAARTLGPFGSDYVILTVGPSQAYHGQPSTIRGRPPCVVTATMKSLLEQAYHSSMNEVVKTCRETGKRALVLLPCISTGVYGYPSSEAALDATYAILQWATTHPAEVTQHIAEVQFVCFQSSDFGIYNRILTMLSTFNDATLQDSQIIKSLDKTVQETKKMLHATHSENMDLVAEHRTNYNELCKAKGDLLDSFCMLANVRHRNVALITEQKLLVEKVLEYGTKIHELQEEVCTLNHKTKYDKALHTKDPAHQDPSHQDLSHQDPSHQDPTHQDPSHQDPSHQDPSHQDPAHQTSSFPVAPCAVFPVPWVRRSVRVESRKRQKV
jgi:O-acetyl-ADP-ribose deacetylase (regulator of RNase III)